MFGRLKKYKERVRRGDENGFTLIELLVVIAILGILAAIVVFSVAGIQDKGQLSACKIDTQTIQTAQEANFAAKGSYANGTAALVTNGFLSTASNLHDVVSPAPGATAGTNTYFVKEASSTCGTTGDAVGGTVPAGTTGQPATNDACRGSGSSPGAAPGWGDC
ncbi:MAG: hypothetical protein QOF30_1939 [Acidimicrobiaceae bacterium]|jgi:general secretion pathway protein G|nr:hypothetical protein [Acidimicrobiaceae bacterium]